jgi:hypothetical protein
MEHNIRAGRKRVARLMKAAGISGVRPRKRWRTTIRIPGITPATDLVERQFRPASSNVVWVADITALRAGRAGCTSPRCRTPTGARSSAGRWPPTCARPWSSTRSRWRSPASARARADPSLRPGLAGRIQVVVATLDREELRWARGGGGGRIGLAGRRCGHRDVRPSPHVPLSTLRPRPHERARMTRGRRGSLIPRRRALPSPSPCRFIPAHHTQGSSGQ